MVLYGKKILYNLISEQNTLIRHNSISNVNKTHKKESVLHQDKIENFKGCVIQHGKYNNRLYLMRCPEFPDRNLADDLIQMAHKKGYTKIFVKIPESVSNQFSRAGFIEEARIPIFYSDRESALFMAFYPDSNRKNETDIEKINHHLAVALDKENTSPISYINPEYLIRKSTEQDLATMARLYRRVFATYPFPIYDPGYLFDTLQCNVEYFCIESDGQIVAVSAAELDKKNLTAEMTDFATSPGWRSKRLAQRLLAFMERKLRKKKIRTAYTIARALSAGMNITFSKSGYTYAGRLKNNTNIAGSIESMNVWYKCINK